MPRSELSILFPKLVLGFIPVIANHFSQWYKLIFLSAWKILYKEQHKIIIDKGNDYGTNTVIN